MRSFYIFTALLLTFFAQATWALGLGNIDLHSNLGQRLSASIPLSDTTNQTESACFKLSKQSDVGPSQSLQASIKLQKLANGNAVLNIKSSKVFNDPIISLIVTYHCEEQLARNYTVLLDPPLYESSTTSAPNNNNTLSYQNQTGTSRNVIEEDKITIPKPPKPKRKKKRQSKRKKISAPDTRLSTSISDQSDDTNGVSSGGGESTQAAVVPSNNQNSPSADPSNGSPRLIVSGGASGMIPSPALRLEMTMSGLPPAEMVGQVIELNDLSDDVTAMANKLEHLESQIVILQERNRVLEAANKSNGIKAAPTAAEKIEKVEKSSSNWWIYILLLLLILILAALAEWYRRRKQSLHLDIDGHNTAPWKPKKPANEDDDPLNLGSKDAESNNESTTGEEKPSKAHSYVYTPEQEEITEVNEGILEQAEVFVAHGRSNLAITLLQDNLKDHPKASPAPWLLLLSLLKKEGNEEEYDIAANACRKYFNFFVPSFAEAIVEDNSSIEDYPQAKEKVVESWGSPESIPVLDGLIYNHREEARQGFERSAYIDILLLRSIAESQGLSDLSNTPTASNSEAKEISNNETISGEEAIAKVSGVAAAASTLAATESESVSHDQTDSITIPEEDALLDDPLGLTKSEDDDNTLDFNLDWSIDDIEETDANASDDEKIDPDGKDKSDKSRPLDFDLGSE